MKALFLDIETSINQAYLFGTGNQYINISSISTETNVISISYANWQELDKGIINNLNMYNKKTDEQLIKKIHKVLCKHDYIIAHNVSFDMGILRARFMKYGLSIPVIKEICTYRTLHKFKFQSKKLDYLSGLLLGTSKGNINMADWIGCSKNDRESYNRMIKYNNLDVTETLFPLYKAIHWYLKVDFVDFSKDDPKYIKCPHDNSILLDYGLHYINTRAYYLYKHKTRDVYYRSRMMTTSKMNRGLIVL